jgi:hypothetical protein
MSPRPGARRVTDSTEVFGPDYATPRLAAYTNGGDGDLHHAPHHPARPWGTPSGSSTQTTPSPAAKSTR